MYAIIEHGGHQHRVAEGETIHLEKGSLPANGEVVFDRVLLIGGRKKPLVGRPYVPQAKAEGRAGQEIAGEKLVTQHYRRRKDSRTRTGHRQWLVPVTITKITAGGGKASAAKKTARKQESEKDGA